VGLAKFATVEVLVIRGFYFNCSNFSASYFGINFVNNGFTKIK